MAEPSEVNGSSNPHPPAAALRRESPLWMVLALVLPVVAGVLIGIDRWGPGGAELHHGDLTTDANILNAAKTFERQGMRPTLGLPTLDTYAGGAEGSTPDLYMTYPPGAYWWHMLLRGGGGLDELREFRIAAVAASTLAAVLFVVLCRRLTGSWMIAAIAGLLMTASRPFIEYADNIHYLSLSQVTLFGTLLAWLAFERDRTRDRRAVLLPGEAAAPEAAAGRAHSPWMLALCAGLFALDCLITFEHTLFILLVCGVRALLVPGRRKSLIGGAVLLGLVPVLVLAARIAQNAAVVGGFGKAIAAFRGKFEQRTGLQNEAFSWEHLLSAWVERLGGLGAKLHSGAPSAEFGHPILTLAVLIPAGAMLFILLATAHLPALRRARLGLGNGLLLTIGALTWWLAMREHAYVHRYLVLLLLPGLSLTLASLIVGGWSQRRAHAPRAAAARPLTRESGSDRELFIPVRWFAPLGACVLLIACLAPLRGSFTINRHWTLNNDVQAALAGRAASEASIKAAATGGAFEGLSRLIMFEHDAHLAYKLGVPFDNPPHAPDAFERLAAGEAVLIPTWREAGRAAALAAARTVGLPRHISPGDGRHFFFATPPEATEVRFRGDRTLSRLSLMPSLDNEQLVVSALFAAPLKPKDARSLTLLVRVKDADSGRLIGRARATPAQGLMDDQGFAVWAAVPLSKARPGARIEISLRAKPNAPPLPIAADHLTLPPGARLMDDGATIAFDILSTAAASPR